MAISGHFSANCMFIFHKNQVQTVILRCLTGLNFDWLKSYGLRWRWRPRNRLANSQKKATEKCPFYYHIWPFFANCMFIYHKTEVQTVILRCLTSLNLNWYNRHKTKRKNTKNARECFCTKLHKTKNGNICILCHNLWTNQILDLLSTSKFPSEPQSCEKLLYSWQKYGQK